MRKSIFALLLTIPTFTAFGITEASAGSWCDAAREQSPSPQTANPAAGNPFRSGAAGATLGSAIADWLFCSLGW
jgi:hypothetical protein